MLDAVTRFSANAALLPLGRNSIETLASATVSILVQTQLLKCGWITGAGIYLDFIVNSLIQA